MEDQPPCRLASDGVSITISKIELRCVTLCKGHKMKYRLLEVLECPTCASELNIIVLHKELTDVSPLVEDSIPVCQSSCPWSDQYGGQYQQCTACYAHEIISGVLQCANNHLFPVTNGIPRLFAAANNPYWAFIKNHSYQLPERIKDTIEGQIGERESDFENQFRATLESFSSEWKELGEGGTAWGRSIDERRDLFLYSFDITIEDLRDKKVLDAGCGHGEVELALRDVDAEIFAFDLSNSVDYVKTRLEKISERYYKLPVHIVQGNIHAPPFKPHFFDFVYSAGVLHHTPDTYTGFKNISKRVKPLGACFIEVYSTDHKNVIEYVAYRFFNILRKITVRLPHSMLHGICYALVPLLYFYITFFRLIARRKRYITRNIKEMELSLFDALSPPYDWHHTTDEVIQWFRTMGYQQVKKTYFNQNGIGITGIWHDQG